MKSVNSISGGRTSGYMLMHYPADVNLFELVEIEDERCTPKDKKLVQMVSDKIGHQFIATAEDDKTLKVLFDLEQMSGQEIIWLTGPTYDEILRTKYEFGGVPGRLPSWARRYCTVRMKLIPSFHYIFLHLFTHMSDQVVMRIGYRAGEQVRREKFFERGNEYIDYPLQCNNYGEFQQRFTRLHWRQAEFPLIDDHIFHNDVIKYWQDKTINFPKISNCVGCFHKDPLTLKQQWDRNPEKMQWFADQEKNGMGHWLDVDLTYDTIRKINFTLPISFQDEVCDSGGCTD